MTSSEEPESTIDYRGVAGWLLWLCFTLTVFNPILLLIALVGSYIELSLSFGRNPGSGAVFAIETTLNVVLCAFGVYAGMKLGQIRPNAVPIAKTYFLCLLAYQAIVSVLPFMAGLPSENNRAILKELARDGGVVLIHVAIWYSYLNRSRRVRATYA